MVVVNAISVRIQKQAILNELSCLLPAGRITTFIGKSGAGKTTVLKSIAGLVATTEGSITLKSKQLNKLSWRERAQEIGYVFQEFNLFPHLSVLDNCIDPLIVHGMTQQKAEQRARQALQELEMESFAHKYPVELSGGQQQRVAIARALCFKPNVLLLDEPSASLDPFNTDLLVTILKQLAAQGLTIGISSQDMSFVHKLFDRVYYMKNGTIVELCEDKATIRDYPLIAQFM